MLFPITVRRYRLARLYVYRLFIIPTKNFNDKLMIFQRLRLDTEYFRSSYVILYDGDGFYSRRFLELFSVFKTTLKKGDCLKEKMSAANIFYVCR